jgi:hypothetical protein
VSQFNARKICEKALRKIGAFPINDTAADPEHLDEALDWLDLNLAQVSGTGRAFWLVPSTLPLPLTAETAEYDLLDVLATNAPDDGIQSVVSAVLDDGNGNRTPLTLIGRAEFEEIAVPATTGTPDRVYVDRLNNPTLTTYPVLGAGITGYTIQLVVQTFSKDFASHKTGNTATGLRETYQKWCIYDLAASLGDGSIIKLPERELAGIRSVAKDAFDKLDAFDNRENSAASRIQFRDF